MRLTRADFEDGGLREQLRSDHPDFSVLSDAEVRQSLDETLAAHPAPGQVWVFAYGSLVWNPTFHHVERRVAKLEGFHRRFCIWSRAYRGTPKQPGLVLGLDEGGACRGIAYRLDPAAVRQELLLLWRREMLSNAYLPRWLKLSTQRGAESEDLHAIGFVVNHANPGYAGKLPMEQVITLLAGGCCGHAGTPAEYLFETVAGLQAHGLRDNYLLDVKKRLIEHQAAGSRAAASPGAPPAHGAA